jgi:hypothetical protein
VFISYGFTLYGALMWLFTLQIRSRRNWTDRVLPAGLPGFAQRLHE